MSLCLISVPKLIHAFPHSPIIAVFVCCHFTSYLSTFCQLHVHTIRLLPIFHKYQTNPIDPHSSWLHSGKLVCLQAISQPLVSWQKSYAYSGIVSHKKKTTSKKFSVAANFTHTYVAFFPYSHIFPPWKCQWTHRSQERPRVSKKNIDRTGAWRQAACPSCPYHLDQALRGVFLWGAMEDTINILCLKLCKCVMYVHMYMLICIL